jgi:hypothetical protein
MRLQAKVELTYAGKLFRPGMLFDALERDGLVLINRDQAVRFNLEDPSMRNLGDAIENLLPSEPPPAEPAVVSLSPDVAPALATGGTGTITVTIIDPGTWVVEGDPAAPWLTYNPITPQSSGGTVNWTAGVNGTGEVRQGVLHINGEPFTVNQAAG